MIQYYPGSGTPIWLNNEFCYPENCTHVMNLSIPFNPGLKFGIGIDIEARMFYIVYQDLVQSFHFKAQPRDSKYNFRLRGAERTSSTEKLRINFGQQKFTYNTNLVAWNKNFPHISHCSQKYHSYFLFVYLFLI